MKPLPWARSALALCVMGTLTACGGGGTDANNEGDIVTTPPPVSSSSGGGASSGGTSSGGSSGGDIPSGPIIKENFGDGLFVNFDAADTEFFFSPDYKALTTPNPLDVKPSFYYPTCCFFLNDTPADGIEVNLAQLGIVSDNGNPAMLLDTGRFSAGQTKPEKVAKDPKKDTTEGATTTWGELDLSRDYRISFCVKEVSGSRNMQVFVDNNTSSEAKSYWKGGSDGSRIFNVPVTLLAPGKRVEINVPGNITLEPGGEVKDIRPKLVGNESSFLQFRVEGGSTVIIDDLLVEYQDENGQAELPACNVFTPAEVPGAPEVPSVSAGDGQVTVSWSDVVGATQYDLAYGSNSDVSQAKPVENVTSPYLLEGLTNDIEYFVFLRVANSVGAGEWSAASTATPKAPVAPVGDSCVPTSQVSTTIPWGVYDGCLSPSEAGSVVINTSVQTTFDFGSSDASLFAAVTDEEGNGLGTSLLNTTSDAAAKSYGTLTEIFGSGYPRHFTAIARVKAGESTQRGFELQTYFGDAEKRVGLQLRPDQGDGRVQMEKFTDSDGADGGDTDVKADFPAMLDGEFHIYHVAFTMTDANTLNAKVYVDGSDVPVIDQTSTGRASSGENQFYIGENASSAHKAEVDWIIWSTDPLAAAKTPTELVGELPATIGELGAYAGDDEDPGEPASGSWTAATLDLAGESGMAPPTGSVLVNEDDAVTITAAGGSVDSSSLRKYFAYREVDGYFTFTARLKSVVTTAGGAFETTGNSNRFGVALMESITAPASALFTDVGRFATVDFYLSDATAQTFKGSRAHKLDVGAGSSRSRSDISELAIGDYLRIQVVDDNGAPRVIRSVSQDGVNFVQANSSKFADANGNGYPSSWFVGFYGAPGDDLTLEFDQITITQE